MSKKYIKNYNLDVAGIGLDVAGIGLDVLNVGYLY
jgi:hypothetical protein